MSVRAVAWVNGLSYLLPKGEVTLGVIQKVLKDHGKKLTEDDDLEVTLLPVVATIHRFDLETKEGDAPWCAPCNSWHARPKDAAHHRALKCRGEAP